MEENEQTPVANLAGEATLLDEYNKLKANSVPKEQYERDLNAEKERSSLYLKAITEGAKVDAPSDEEDSKTLGEAIEEMSRFKGTNLEYWTKMTPLIDRTIKSLPEKEIVKITGSDGLDEILRVNEGMKELVKKANGDPDYFRVLYKNSVTESSPKIASEIERAGGLVNYLENLQK